MCSSNKEILFFFFFMRVFGVLVLCFHFHFHFHFFFLMVSFTDSMQDSLFVCVVVKKITRNLSFYNLV